MFQVYHFKFKYAMARVNCNIRFEIGDRRKSIALRGLYFWRKSVKIELTRNIEMEYIDYEFIIIGKYYKSVYRTCTA